MSNRLDLNSVLKTSQTLASEIVLTCLLEKLMSIVLDNTGAQHGFLLVEQAEQWFIEASNSSNHIKLEPANLSPPIPLEKFDEISSSIIHHVARTKETLVLNDAAQSGEFTSDPYILKRQPKSVLCTPLLNQDQIAAILYLENNLTTAAFTSDKLEVLHLLSAQMAISIENARLYAGLEEKLKQHTRQIEAQQEELSSINEQLSTAQQKLQIAQQQLVESEKMAALGNLVAGVAHEINTPVGVGVTAASQLDRLTKDFAQLYKNGSMTRTHLENYLNSAHQSSVLILRNLTRAAELTKSFKQVAVDQSSEQKRTFMLKEYLHEIITSLKPELKHTQHEILIECDSDLKLFTYAGAISQILTNLIINSIQHGFQNKSAGQITIKTTTKDHCFILSYSDNGRGIPTEIISHIFEPFFTTNHQGGGTGLGLHIVYNLVTHKLEGLIHCESVEDFGTTFILEIPLTR